MAAVGVLATPTYYRPIKELDGSSFHVPQLSLERFGELCLVLSVNLLQHDLNVGQIQPTDRRRYGSFVILDDTTEEVGLRNG